MVGATAVTLTGGDVGMAAVPLAVGLLAAFVAYGRWRLAPHRGRLGEARPAGGGGPSLAGKE